MNQQINRRSKPAFPGDRTLVPDRRTEHRAGWVAAAMNRLLPDGATSDFSAGYAENKRGAEFAQEDCHEHV